MVCSPLPASSPTRRCSACCSPFPVALELPIAIAGGRFDEFAPPIFVVAVMVLLGDGRARCARTS